MVLRPLADIPDLLDWATHRGLPTWALRATVLPWVRDGAVHHLCDASYDTRLADAFNPIVSATPIRGLSVCLDASGAIDYAPWAVASRDWDLCRSCLGVTRPLAPAFEAVTTWWRHAHDLSLTRFLTELLDTPTADLPRLRWAAERLNAGMTGLPAAPVEELCRAAQRALDRHRHPAGPGATLLAVGGYDLACVTDDDPLLAAGVQHPSPLGQWPLVAFVTVDPDTAARVIAAHFTVKRRLLPGFVAPLGDPVDDDVRHTAEVLCSSTWPGDGPLADPHEALAAAKALHR